MLYVQIVDEINIVMMIPYSIINNKITQGQT